TSLKQNALSRSGKRRKTNVSKALHLISTCKNGECRVKTLKRSQVTNPTASLCLLNRRNVSRACVSLPTSFHCSKSNQCSAATSNQRKKSVALKTWSSSATSFGESG